MKKVFVSGHNGMVGSALIRACNSRAEEYETITRNRKELDLCNQLDVHHFLSSEKPDIVINAAGRVGGIYANNTFPAEFIRENLLININLIHASYEVGVTRFLNLGSSCIYPREAEQPLKEESLLTGPLEPTNSAYALAKIAGLEMCRHYRTQYGVLFHSAMPTNLYGPGDNYDELNSHFFPALIQKIVKAKKNKIDFQRLAASRSTGTDTDAFAYSNMGVASALISLPLRYMHTTVEMCSKDDVNSVIELIYQTIISLKKDQTFNYLK